MLLSLELGVALGQICRIVSRNDPFVFGLKPHVLFMEINRKNVQSYLWPVVHDSLNHNLPQFHLS